MRIIPYDDACRDDMLFLILSALVRIVCLLPEARLYGVRAALYEKRTVNPKKRSPDGISHPATLFLCYFQEMRSVSIGCLRRKARIYGILAQKQPYISVFSVSADGSRQTVHPHLPSWIGFHLRTDRAVSGDCPPRPIVGETALFRLWGRLIVCSLSCVLIGDQP